MTADDRQRLLDRIAGLEEVLGQGSSLQGRIREAFGLERLHAQILGMLYSRDFVTRDGLYTVLYGARPESDWPKEKVLDVQICKMRRHLEKKHGFVRGDIETKWGEGWRLAKAAKARIAQQIDFPACQAIMQTRRANFLYGS